MQFTILAAETLMSLEIWSPGNEIQISGDGFCLGNFVLLFFIIFKAHPASCTMVSGSFPGVKRPERGVDHPPHLAPRLKRE